MKKNISLRISTITLLILLAAFSRLIPHPSNFAPIGAMALFGAAYFTQRYLAFLIPIVSMWLSDLVLNNVVYGRYFDRFVWGYDGCYWTYGAFILIGLVGFVLLKKVKPQRLIVASLSASVLFFLISNFGVWASGTMYPKSLSGLITCYAAGIPFFKNTLLGDLVYCSVMFGAFEFAQYKFPVLRYHTVSTK
ncbi:MAG: hypothetical protein BWX62_01273 [Bacteroidetes bacterium ADurb.Bin037]|nr:MAG: hypothetical protein BWX62_01273 [Bacteroidetes bacterium ADurb.Bin037]